MEHELSEIITGVTNFALCLGNPQPSSTFYNENGNIFDKIDLEVISAEIISNQEITKSITLIKKLARLANAPLITKQTKQINAPGNRIINITDYGDCFGHHISLGLNKISKLKFKAETSTILTRYSTERNKCFIIHLAAATGVNVFHLEAEFTEACLSILSKANPGPEIKKCIMSYLSSTNGVDANILRLVFPRAIRQRVIRVVKPNYDFTSFECSAYCFSELPINLSPINMLLWNDHFTILEDDNFLATIPGFNVFYTMKKINFLTTWNSWPSLSVDSSHKPYNSQVSPWPRDNKEAPHKCICCNSKNVTNITGIWSCKDCMSISKVLDQPTITSNEDASKSTYERILGSDKITSIRESFMGSDSDSTSDSIEIGNKRCHSPQSTSKSEYNEMVNTYEDTGSSLDEQPKLKSSKFKITSKSNTKCNINSKDLYEIERISINKQIANELTNFINFFMCNEDYKLIPDSSHNQLSKVVSQDSVKLRKLSTKTFTFLDSHAKCLGSTVTSQFGGKRWEIQLLTPTTQRLAQRHNLEYQLLASEDHIRLPSSFVRGPHPFPNTIFFFFKYFLKEYVEPRTLIGNEYQFVEKISSLAWRIQQHLGDIVVQQVPITIQQISQIKISELKML